MTRLQVDELLQWTTALNFDDYLEVWKESATSTISEVDIPSRHHSVNNLSSNTLGGAIPTSFDPYALTRDSSIGGHQPNRSDGPGASSSTVHVELRGLGKGDSPAGANNWKVGSAVTSKHALEQSA